MDSEALQGGRVIAGRYRLDGELDRGGMGSVWRAEHLALCSPVAIKLLDPAIGKDPEMVERFMREARAAAALRSMHVVQIFDYGLDEGVPFIAMELLIGESLRDRLTRVGALTPHETLRVFTHVTRAVAKAHEAGVIHRDLKPENVFLVTDDEETAKVLDFGIAKVDGARIADTGNIETLSGRLLGTPHYMSPEQARGEPIDHRSDLWALAVIGFECITGARPFDSAAVGDLILRICTENPPRPSFRAVVPDGFDAWFEKGVSRDPKGRFDSAKEMCEAFAALLGPVVTPISVAPSPVQAVSDGTSAPTWVSEGAPPPPTPSALPTLAEQPSTVEVPLEPSPMRRLSVALPVAAIALGVGAWLVLGRGASGESPEVTGQSTSTASPASSASARAAVQAEERRDASAEKPPTVAPQLEPRRTAPVPPPAKPGVRTRRPPELATAPASSAEPRAASEVAPALVPEPPRRSSGREIFSDRE